MPLSYPTLHTLPCPACTDPEAEARIFAEAEPTEMEVRLQLTAQVKDGETTMFAITMMCIDPEFEAQAVEFLQHAFDAFPDKVSAERMCVGGAAAVK